jgi:hypothetical protein
MAKSILDLSPSEFREHQARIMRALQGHEANKADLARRREQALSDPPPIRTRRTEKAAPAAPQRPAPEDNHPVQRPASAPRDWRAEGAYFTSLANNATDGKIAQLVEGVGIAIAEIRKELQKEFEAKLILARRDLADEVRREFGQRIDSMRSEFRTALAGDEAALEKRLKRLDDVIDRWSRLELATRDMHTITVRPN